MPTPIAYDERRAAEALCLSRTEFVRLVDQGALPPPVKIGPHKRWRVEDLQAILSGNAALPDEDFSL